MTDNIKLPLVATSDHPEFPVLAWSPLELAEINRLMREAVRLNAQADTKPMFWVRLCSNGFYEGPIHDSQIEDVRKHSGAWHPLYLAAPAAPAAPQPAQPARTALEQYDLEQSEDYRKGYDDGRVRGYEVGYRQATEHAAMKSQSAQQPLTDAQIDTAASRARDELLDHIYECGTLSEGIMRLVRRLARAIEQAHGIGVKND